MKTYRHLYEEVISDENIKLAIKESCKSRKKSKRKKEQLEALRNDPGRVEKVRKWITGYKRRRCQPKEIYDGISRKKRFIYVPNVRETVVQHAVVQVLDKYLMKGLYEHTYAAIKGRGSHKAKKWLERKIRNSPKAVKYYLKMDIRQYFPSVPQDRLMEKLERQVADHRVIKLVRDIIGAADHGIPLGYFISQWIANYYLLEFDHYIKERLKCRIYVRWMDDMVVFASSKKWLHGIKDAFAAKLNEIGLELKGNWRIERFSYRESPDRKKSRGCFLDYMGFRFYRNRTTLRESIFYRMCRKARLVGSKDRLTAFETRQFMSYLGWLKHTDTYNAYVDYIKPYVSIRKMKKRISRYDKNRRDAENDLQTCDRQSGEQAA